MLQDGHKKCYGTMFPPILHAETDKPMSGKVFTFEVKRAGGTFVSQRRVSTNAKEWDDCLQCPEFEHCYKFCMGRLALETAVKD
jgi:hypothetical protein